ncbi:MAG: hypothetical protein N2234_04170 [Planctomycetota bacterium]|nr:hypothetical protein [Planctomycetota bacterium]
MAAEVSEKKLEEKKSRVVILVALVGIFVAVNIYLFAAGRLPSNFEGLGIMIAAGLSLAIYSFLYRDNPIYKFAEHIYIGLSVGYIIVYNYYNALKPNLLDKLFFPPPGERAELWLIVPLFFGILMFFRFSPKHAWVSRWSFAFIVGYGSGMAIPRGVKTMIFAQMEATLRPIEFFDMYGNFNFTAIATLIAIVGILAVLIYFFFSLEHKGPLKVASRVGVWFIMIAFGAQFGYTVMARMSLLIERIRFLLGDWLNVLRS